MDYFNAKIKIFDSTHFSVTTYNYRNKIDYTNENDKKQLKLSDLDDWEYTPSLYDKISDIKRSIEVSRNRAKNMIYDYARTNDFEYFVTMTFNPDKVDSFNYAECSKKLSQWLNNIRKRISPDIRYLFVPELHKSGRYHFHGLIANIGNLELVDSGKRTSSGNTIFNIGSYNLGFTTATRITDKHRTATYIGKYITKELSGHLKNKKHYWASRNLVLPEVKNLTVEQLLEMGFDKEFLENNSIYSKTVEYDVNGQNRKVSFYEFEKNE